MGRGGAGEEQGVGSREEETDGTDGTDGMDANGDMGGGDGWRQTDRGWK